MVRRRRGEPVSTPPDGDRHRGVFDQAAYWLTIVAVYFLVGVLFL
jgi:hypothetical protein